MIDPKVLKLEKYYNLTNYKLILSKRPVNTHDRPFLFPLEVPLREELLKK